MKKTAQFVGSVALMFALSACATAYNDRDSEIGSPLKGLAQLGGMATTVPEAKDFVVESRTDALSYIPVGTPTGGPKDRKQPLTPEELLLLNKKLEAAQRQNGAASPAE